MCLSLSDIPHLSQYKIEKWSTDSVDFSFTSAELLDQHQEVLDIPVKVIPHLKDCSNSPPTYQLEYTWGSYQSTRHTKVLRTLFINPWK